MFFYQGLFRHRLIQYVFLVVSRMWGYAAGKIFIFLKHLLYKSDFREEYLENKEINIWNALVRNLKRVVDEMMMILNSRAQASKTYKMILVWHCLTKRSASTVFKDTLIEAVVAQSLTVNVTVVGSISIRRNETLWITCLQDKS